MPDVPNQQTQVLLRHAAPATPFSSPRGQVFVSVPIGPEAHQVVALRSPAFRGWLIESFYRESGAAPSGSAVREALSTLEAHARAGDWPRQSVERRVASHDGKLILDLHNDAGDAVEISSHSWKLVRGLPYYFRGSRNALALPIPEKPASPAVLNTLLDMLNVPRTDHARVLCWLLAALQPAGPYPLLVIEGRSGSGKSTAARFLRALIDPSASPIGHLPPDRRKLLNLAYHARVLAFDHVARVPSSLAPTLSCLATGDTFDLHDSAGSGYEPVQIKLQRPMILVAHPDTAASTLAEGDLAGRLLPIELPPITPARRRAESELTREFEALHAQALGALCDAAATALARIGNIRLTQLPRFADAALWSAAAAPALGLSEGQVLAALDPGAEIDPLAEALHSLLAGQAEWTGAAGALLDILRKLRPAVAWPSTPKGLSQRLRKVLPFGLEVRFAVINRGRTRHITIRAARDASTERPQAPQKATLAPHA
jgi:hypothetical protein